MFAPDFITPHTAQHFHKNKHATSHFPQWVNSSYLAEAVPEKVELVTSQEQLDKIRAQQFSQGIREASLAAVQWGCLGINFFEDENNAGWDDENVMKYNTIAIFKRWCVHIRHARTGAQAIWEQHATQGRTSSALVLHLRCKYCRVCDFDFSLL